MSYSIDNQGDRLAQTGHSTTDLEIGEEEIRSAGQQQVTIDLTSVITEAKELYDKAMLPTFPAQQVF